MLSIVLLIAVLPGLIILKTIFFSKTTVPSGTLLPAGPKGLPFPGSLLSLPSYHSWLQFSVWSKTYGPLYQISIAGRPQIMLSSAKIANDFLRERGTIYSSREQLSMTAHLLSNNLRPLFLPYNDLWHSGRKLMHHLSMPTAATSYQPIQLEESVCILRDLISQPNDYEKWFERYLGGLIMRLGFGKMLVTGEEEYLERILNVVHTVTNNKFEP